MSEPAPPTSENGPTRLSEFNGLSDEAAAELLRPCLDVDRWVSTMVEQRPYPSVEALLKVARKAATPTSTSGCALVTRRTSSVSAECS